MWTEPEENALRPAVIWSWALFGCVALAILISLATFDFRSWPQVTGDQASHVLQAQSLANDLDMRFEPSDFERWERMGWEKVPRGLFLQKYAGGLGMAKPWLYSAWMAPFVAVFGVVWGFTAGNGLLLIITVGCSLRLLSRRIQGPALPLLGCALFGTSYFYMYAFAWEPALFHACLVSVFCLLACGRGSWGRGQAWLLGAVMALALVEKVSLGLLLGPLFVVVLCQRWRKAGRVLLAFGLVGSAAVLPCLHYSDWQSWTQYGGERYLLLHDVPVGNETRLLTAARGDSEGANREVKHSLANPANSLLGLYYYFFGAFTGVLVFAAAVFFLMFAAGGRLLRHPGLQGWAVGIGIFLCIAGYLVLYPGNYYGGGQTVGNRWFIKVIPAVVALSVLAEITHRAALRIAWSGMMLGVMFLWPHHKAHRTVFSLNNISSGPQRWMPFEKTQYELPSYTGLLRVNLELWPGKPVWQLINASEPAPMVWRENSLVSAEVRRVNRHYWAKVRPEKIWSAWGDGVWVENAMFDGSRDFVFAGYQANVAMSGTAARTFFLWSMQPETPFRVSGDESLEVTGPSLEFERAGPESGFSLFSVSSDAPLFMGVQREK